MDSVNNSAENSCYKILKVDAANKRFNPQESADIQKFEWFRHEFSYKGSPATILYRLLIPTGPIPVLGYPLVMALRGSDGMGTDNHSHMRVIQITSWAGEGWQKDNPCYVLAVQMPIAGMSASRRNFPTSTNIVKS